MKSKESSLKPYLHTQINDHEINTKTHHCCYCLQAIPNLMDYENTGAELTERLEMTIFLPRPNNGDV